MSKQATLKINPSLQKKFAGLLQTAEDMVRDKLYDISNDAIRFSPVDTGAYVESFSIVPRGAGGGRMKSSKARKVSVKKGTASREQFTSEARSNLSIDINNLDLTKLSGVVLRNRSIHARFVEDKHGYHVFRKVRDIHG